MKRSDAPKNISEQVYQRLRDEVLTGSLHPGLWIREQDIAKAWSVSRTPVREAVHRLAHDGLVETSPNRGVRVRALTAKEVQDIYEMRELLEGVAARRAAELATEVDVTRLRSALDSIDLLEPVEVAAHLRADELFHSTIIEIARNEALEDLTHRLNGRVTRVKVITRDTNASTITREQHRAILDAIERHAPGKAEEAMREHIRTHSKIVVYRLQAV